MSEAPNPHFFSRSVEDFGGKISFIITDLIEELQHRNAKSNSGIFRLNGGNKKQTEISQLLDNGRIKEYNQMWDNNTVACTLKKHFRDMTERGDPLFPNIVFDKLSPLIASNKIDNDQFIAETQKVFATFSPPRYYSIVHFIKYLVEVADESESNKMTPSNLAICISPNIFTTPNLNNKEILALNDSQNKIFAKMIELGHQLFDSVKVPKELILEDNEIPKLLARTMDSKESKSFLDWRQMRRKSLIPFVPIDLATVPGFEIPSTPYQPKK
ncbi:RhoGAP domain containing protein [Trichomonas vaginalis G3]|uniref:RhoGAP domain containing protein n=1 Tax=Trichomonas vaginalis (strain ATCC PRA-98 / G3) TaxID=412133 RepID=A2DW78_TRIV3|nr:GTPase activator protein [Trichomonas vaginalis G3]EAY15379.1 RhoGAP domain containing protein [Trichomonas vaginalis G3]KAI5496746.1 GTPase activator protein [Trichomonas vaginalis G3]|eukprot:XP_001327602.1 RhoGAP domain containing protein [Trichomonas vaginalis G3]